MNEGTCRAPWACHWPVVVNAVRSSVGVFPGAVGVFVEIGGGAVAEGELMRGGLAVHAAVGYARGGVWRWKLVWVGVVSPGGPTIVGAWLEGIVVGGVSDAKRFLCVGGIRRLKGGIGRVLKGM